MVLVMRFAKILSIGALLGAFLFAGPGSAQQPGILGPNQLLGNPSNAGGAPVPVSPLAARGPLLLDIDQLVKPGDANYTILSTDRAVAHTALTAARTDTLPAANSLNAGQHILNTDFYGVVTATNTVTIQRAGSDTVNGGTSVVLNAVGNSFDCVSDGISAWACTLGARAGSAGITGCINGLSASGANCQILPARLTLPTTQVFTSGTSLTYTTPANVLWIEVMLVGGGGGGGAQATNNGVAGGNTTFSTFTASGGTGGLAGGGGPGSGGTASGGYLNIQGGSGTGGSFTSVASVDPAGGTGGNSCLGGAGGGGQVNAGGLAATPNSGSGGGGGGAGSGTPSGAGGGSGGCVRAIINSPAATYTYTVGAGGAGGAAGLTAGGNGGAGVITVIEHYGT
jgi:hypothetical protein